jgi:cell wall-associated NlpC family hydrolase
MGLLEKSDNTTGEERGTLNKSVLVAALSVALISTGLANPDKGSAKHTPRGHRGAESGSSAKKATIIGEKVNVRTAPDSGSDVIIKVTGGKATILAQKGDWYKLKFQYGTQGWVRQDFLKVDGHFTAKVTPIKLDPMPVVVTKSGSKPVKATSEGLTRYALLVNRTVNIHRGPSSSNSVSGHVKGGKALILDRAGDFYRVQLQYGSKGWVKASSLEFPQNFDFKNDKNKPKTLVASKSTPKSKPEKVVSTPENTVEVVGTGEKISIPAEEPAVRANENSEAIMATVIGDNVTVRKGASKSNSVLKHVDGGRAAIIDHRGDFYQLKFTGGTVGWVHSDYVSFPGHIVREAPKMPINSGDPDTASRVITNARTFRGVRYSYGSQGRGATDCSGFTLQVFRSIGIELPRTAAQQCKRGTRVKRSQLETGDLVFFNTRGYVSHVGIYIGNDRFIHASSGAGHVTESSLNENYYNNRFLFGARILSPSKVKKLDLPSPGDIPTEITSDRDDNKVDISKGKEPGSGRD